MTTSTIKQLGENPYTIIKELRDSLREVIAKSFHLKSTENVMNTIEHLKILMYKLNYAQLTNDKTIISITGLQGVGKTKILRDLYRLDDSILPSDGGRGEALPVLFTESKDVTTITYFVRRAKKDASDLYKISDDEINLTEFNAIASDPHIDDLWLEAKVPQTHFNNEISLALLPGFEKDTTQQSQRYLQTLLDLSTSVILVFNHKKLALHDQKILVEEMSRDYQKNKPIFALSFAEELNEDQKEKLADDIANKFNIATSERNRIVFTGIGESYINYPKQIIDNMYTYSYTNAEAYKKQLRMLQDLAKEIPVRIQTLEEELNIQKTDKLMDEYKDDANKPHLPTEINKAFTSYRKNIVNKITNEINKQFNYHIKDASDQMNYIIENERTSIVDKAKSFFTTNVSFKEKQEFERLIEQIWKGENEIESEKRLISALENYVQTELQTIQTSIIPPKKPVAIEMESSKQANPLLNPHKQSQKPLAHNEEIQDALAESISNIEKYLNDHDDLSITLKKEDLRVLPLAAVAFAQELVAASLVLEQDDFSKLNEMDQNDILNQSKSLTEQFSDLAMNTSTTTKAAAIFFGIDALDGTFDSFGALTSVLTKVGVPAAYVAPVGGLLIGALGSTLAIVEGNRRIEKYKFERSKMAGEVFNAIGSSQQQATISTINNLLDTMENKLIEAYHKRNGVDEQFGQMDELNIRISRLEQQCSTLMEMAFRSESFIN